MSATASFTLLPTQRLEDIPRALKANRFDAFLRDNGRIAASYAWSGFVLATVLPYLEERLSIDLMRSEYDAVADKITSQLGISSFVLTRTQQERYRRQLSAAAQAAPAKTDELTRYYNELNETAEPEDVGRAMADGIVALRDALNATTETECVLLTIR